MLIIEQNIQCGFMQIWSSTNLWPPLGIILRHVYNKKKSSSYGFWLMTEFVLTNCYATLYFCQQKLYSCWFWVLPAWPFFLNHILVSDDPTSISTSSLCVFLHIMLLSLVYGFGFWSISCFHLCNMWLGNQCLCFLFISNSEGLKSKTEVQPFPNRHNKYHSF